MIDITLPISVQIAIGGMFMSRCKISLHSVYIIQMNYTLRYIASITMLLLREYLLRLFYTDYTNACIESL